MLKNDKGYCIFSKVFFSPFLAWCLSVYYKWTDFSLFFNFFNAKLFSKVQFCQCSNNFLKKILVYASLKWGHIDNFHIILEDIASLFKTKNIWEFTQCSLQYCFLGRLRKDCSGVFFVEIHLCDLNCLRKTCGNRTVQGYCRTLEMDVIFTLWLHCNFFSTVVALSRHPCWAQSSPCCHLRW